MAFRVAAAARPCGCRALAAQPGIQDPVDIAKYRRHDDAEQQHDVPANRSEPEAHMKNHGQAGKDDHGHRHGREFQEWIEGRGPQPQAQGRLEHLHSRGTQAKIGEEHPADPHDYAEQVQQEQDLKWHGLTREMIRISGPVLRRPVRRDWRSCAA